MTDLRFRNLASLLKAALLRTARRKARRACAATRCRSWSSWAKTTRTAATTRWRKSRRRRGTARSARPSGTDCRWTRDSLLPLTRLHQRLRLSLLLLLRAR